MKVNPVSNEEKSLLLQNNSKGFTGASTANLQSLSRSRPLKKERSHNCNRLLKRIVDGRISMYVMSCVTIYALIGDDLRVWLTSKPADPYFYSGLCISFGLFGVEIFINSLVQVDYKYSFFFWLDIIATLSLIPDIRWMNDLIGEIVNAQPSYLSVNAIPGYMSVQSASQAKIQKLVKALRLIRLVRIIKLYKYISQSNKAKDENQEEEEKKKKKEREENNDNDTSTTEENEQQSLFMKETDPSKLGKALSDTTTRRVIIGVLLMLMVLPLLTYSDIDFSQAYAMREIFWFGRSSCPYSTDPNTINALCPQQPWLSQEGWYELLRNFVTASIALETDPLLYQALWIYIPDFLSGGRMNNINFIPQRGSNSTVNPYWQQLDSCAGFAVSDSCPYRYEEMMLVTFTPIECLDGTLTGCDDLVAYARYNKQAERQQEAIYQFATTLFTCFVLTAASLIFSNDAERIVIKPIKKIIMIIQKLAENPLKKPEAPKKDQDMEKSQMKTQMLEQTIFKIGTLLQRGFGELGAKVVAQTLTNNEDFMDLMVPGQQMHMIFSVCRIRQFTETTESLQDEIIVFVNKIVKIIHEVAKKWEGQPAKNYGEKFLLVWKLPTAMDKETLQNIEQLKSARPALLNQATIAAMNGPTPGGPNTSQGGVNLTMTDKFNQTGKLPDINAFFVFVYAALLQSHSEQNDQELEQERQAKVEEDLLEKRQQIADKALILQMITKKYYGLSFSDISKQTYYNSISAVKIIVELRRAQDLQAYARHPKILQKFSGQYQRTCVTFGLHCGWAIEGAIGSDFKIDALHLSPDASIAQRIEQFCQMFDTSILLTQDLQKLLSEKGKSFLRLVDNIVMNETREARELYTFDIQFKDQIDTLPISRQELNTPLGALIKHAEFDNIDTAKGDSVDSMYAYDHDFYTIRKQKKDNFENNFRQAYQAYQQADWNSAQNYLTQCLEINPDDGPSLQLSEYMEKHKNLPPDGWLGYHDLDEKDPAPTMSFIRAGFPDEGDMEGEEVEDDDSMS